jgi:hypothetical protein
MSVNVNVVDDNANKLFNKTLVAYDMTYESRNISEISIIIKKNILLK